MSKKHLKNLKNLLKDSKYYNSMAPFPVFDTDWIKDIENKIKMIKEDEEINYDDLPVVACRYCKSLHIITDEDLNDICFRCGSKNELLEFENIYEYEKFKKSN